MIIGETGGQESTMKHFAFFYFMKAKPREVQEAAPQHSEHWRTAAPRAYRGGPFADRSGGLIIFAADSSEVAEGLVAADPFVRLGLLERHWLKEWTPL
jgi:uncharacterized protein YciI